jgi:hypothetical protein
MKKLLVAVCLTPLLWSGIAQAQQGDDPSLIAVELYGCNYAEGKGPKDLDKVVGKWNKWSDANSRVPYNAWTLTPMFRTGEQTLDVGWLGVWQNGADMGRGTQEWLGQTGMQAEFDSVIPCNSHGAYTTANVKPPGKNWPTPSGVTVFADCTVAEGKNLEDAMAVHNAWAQHLTSKGSTASMWIFFPAFGGNDVTGDYKVVNGYDDYTAWGKDYNDYTNGGGWRKARELMAGVLSCDSPRVYTTTLRRSGGVKPS